MSPFSNNVFQLQCEQQLLVDVRAIVHPKFYILKVLGQE